jgi:hypothetical protein
MLIELLPKPPLQISCPERFTCSDIIGFLGKVNLYNGIKPKIYFSLYSCDSHGSFKDAKITKISFDFDNENAIKNAKSLSDFCLRENYRHCIIFSTKGCWVHILTKNYEKLRYNKSALKYAQKAIAEKVCLSIGDEHLCDIDHHIIGDSARVARMPGTLDTRRGLYAQSVKREDLTTIEHLKEMAKEQSSAIYWYGNDFLDMLPYDKADEFCELPEIPADFDYNIQLDDDEKILSKFSPCIVKILKEPAVGTWRGRWLAVLYMKEIGIPIKIAHAICKKYFGAAPRSDEFKNNYNHLRKVKVLELVYGNPELFFPRCEILYNEEFCKGKCKNYNKLYR